MRGQLTFRIEGYDKQIVVTELTIKQILQMFKLDGVTDAGSWSDILSYMQNQILAQTVNLTVDELLDFTPTEVELIWKKVQEVNKTFFGLARTQAIKSVFEKILPKMIEGCGNSLSGLFRLGTPTPKNTDTPISSTP